VRPAVAVLLLLAAAPAAGQTQEPVGPYVVDLRGATSGLPNDTAFYPGVPPEDTIVPARGFGFDAGGHVYLFALGPSRVGVGVNYVRVRGTAGGSVAVVSALAPQVSFNFGGRDGWSYLSAGPGRAWVETSLADGAGTLTRESGALNALNAGGGARWFIASRLAVGFDVRWHRISGPPRTTLLAASVGVSVR
jgi:hypothetical protein